MPTILSYTPRWLSRPSPGFEAFKKSHRKGSRTTHHSCKTIACNGTDVFIAAENELRWTNLSLLKADWDTRHSQSDQSPLEPRNGLCKTLNVRTFENIEQLVVSPTGEFLAILTSHCVKVVLLPDFSQMSIDTASLKPTTWQLGPEVHVLNQSPLVTALWHPLAEGGSSLVTVTEDGTVRLWELDKKNRWSADKPSKAFNLTKLAQADSAAADLTPPNSTNDSESSKPDAGIQVASACFGGAGASHENVWSSMTLWIASKQGNLYALCPLLPARWIVPPSSISDLGASIAARSTTLDEATAPSIEEDAQGLTDQLTWIAEILDTTEIQKDDTFDSEVTEIYRTPSIPSSVPKLQGPFEIFPHLDMDMSVSDMIVIPASSPSVSGEPEDEDQLEEDLETKSPMDMICVATTHGSLHILANPCGVEGRWLPFSKLASESVLQGSDPAPELIRLESLPIIDADAECRPAFTPDPASPHSFYITQQYGVSHASLSRWTQGLYQEISVDPDSGSEFRIPLLVESSRVELSVVVTFPVNSTQEEEDSTAASVATCCAVDDEDVGRFVFTTQNEQPHAVELVPARSALEDAVYGEAEVGGASGQGVPGFAESGNRDTFYPPEDLYSELSMPSLPERQAQQFSRKGLYQEKNTFHSDLVPAITEAHRVVMTDKKKLEEAAGAIASRCQGSMEHLNKQVRDANETATKVEEAVDDDVADVDVGGSQQDEVMTIDEKLENAQQRQEDLAARFAEVKERVGAVQGRPVNEKERQWMSEVASLARQLGVGSAGEEDDGNDSRSASPNKDMLMQRLHSVQQLKEQLVSQHNQQHPDNEAPPEPLASSSNSGQRPKSSSPATASPQRMSLRAGESKRMFTSQISHVLERETAMIEAMREKLEVLGFDIGRGVTEPMSALSP